MATTRLTSIAVPGAPQSFSAKTPADYPPVGLLVEEFDLFVESYDAKTVTIFKAGTTDLMPCYSDPALTVSVDNPQVLITKTDSLGNRYGKFATSIYVPFSYQLDISSSEQTGVRQRPITDLAGEIADNAIVKAESSTNYRTLKKRAADRINALDFGDIGTSASNNSTILTSAIARASADGGGVVILPPGLIVFNSINLPSSVILEGQGKDVTVLQSELSDKVITVTGDAAGLRALQLDGVNLLEGSIGVYGRSKDFFLFEEVLTRRFDRNIFFQGGQNHVYRGLFTRNGNRCIQLYGDLDASGTGLGDEFSGLDWVQGEISESTEVGMELKLVDEAMRHNSFTEIDFLDNVGLEGALNLYGASWQYFKQCYWDGNTIDLIIKDNQNLMITDRQVSNIYFLGGQVQGGELRFDGLCESVIFDGVELNECDFNMTTPDNQILLRDCTEDLTLFTGESTRVSRVQTINDGVVKGTTTNATATTVWKTKVRPNEVIQLNVSATAERVNGAGYADFLYCASARCAGSTLNYDSQTANFTAGSTIVGAISGATAIIVSDSDSGTTGVLTLAAIDGAFVDNEVISEDGGTGSATVNGSLIAGAAAVIGTATELRAVGSATGAPPSGWAVTFVALGQEILVKVTGASSNDIFWNVKIGVTVL